VVRTKTEKEHEIDLDSKRNDYGSSENIIELKNLRKVYRIGEEKVVALDDITLDIKKGEFCCLLGTSGSGKSTLLNLMAGLEKPTKGTIRIKGKAIEKMSEKKLAKFRQEHLGFVFQSYNLLPMLTALENVSLPLIFKGVPKAKRDKMAREMIKAVGLSTHEKHKPSQMSGGQQQRVGIARAFVTMPEIVFADEPTGNLDSKTTKEVMELITKMARANNQTLVIVTHDMQIAGYADRIVHILDGNIEKIEVINTRGGSNEETDNNSACSADAVPAGV
jgi:putative ABC transport system ATP-binding protein